MKKKILNICFLVCLLASCNNNPSNSVSKTSTSVVDSSKTSTSTKPFVEYHVSKKLESSKIHAGNEKSITLPTTFFTEVADVPYVELNDFYVNFFSTAIAENASFYTIEASTVKNAFSNATLIFDTAKNTISSTDLDQFTNYTDSTKTSVGFFSGEKNTLVKLNENKTTYTQGTTVTYDLSRYNMNLVNYDNKTYVPFTIVEAITFNPIFTRFIFNGDDYYLCNDQLVLDSKNKTLTEYGTKIASGSAFTNKTRTTTYANYFYNSFLFEMENFNGHFSRLGIDNLDTKLQELGFKEKLLSTDSDIANQAVADVINQVFHDGGHTGFTHRGFTSTYSYDTDLELSKGIITADERLKNMLITYTTLGNMIKGNMPPVVEYSTNNETAVIHLMSFTMHQALTLENIDEDNASTFSIFYHAFKNISENTTVKNVIIDLSLNGGGASIALGEALSFLTDDPVEIRVKNTKTGAILNEAVDVDNDLDGDFTDNDSYSGKYNFYVLTSNFSFSCGNAFPAIAKEKGYAKIIGQKSGGGDCAVLPGIAVDGTSWNMSSTYSIIRSDGSNVDDGAAVDYEIAYENFYNIDTLDTEIKKIK